jgi:tryptophan synthase alpha chain
VTGIAVEEALRAGRAGGRKLLVTYMTGGLGPDWVDYVQVMVENGADLVEIGLPFSDPVMDGPTIQAASLRALEAGANPPAILDAMARREQPVPLVAMTYYNLVFRAGHERFARMLADAGVRGAILPDLSRAPGRRPPLRPGWRPSCWPPRSPPTPGWSSCAVAPAASSTASTSWV